MPLRGSMLSDEAGSQIHSPLCYILQPAHSHSLLDSKQNNLKKFSVRTESEDVILHKTEFKSSICFNSNHPV